MSYQDTSILNDLIEAFNTQMNTVLVTDVTDVTQAGLVRPGNLQDDPTDARINVLIHHGDEHWRDGPYYTSKGIETPVYEIGRTQWWMRRFIIELELFFDGELDRDVARTKAQIILSRSEQSLIDMPVSTDADSFGEQAHELQIADSYLREGGGEGEFIWRGKIFLEVLTSKLRRT